MDKFNNKMIDEFQTTYKVGLLATIDDDGAPHITMLSSLQAASADELIMGQFTEGFSKSNVEKRPETGFLIMTLDRQMWTGTALWRRSETEGAEYDMYNRKPLFRYNTYFGIHRVHYFDLKEISEGKALMMGPIVFHAVLNLLVKPFVKKETRERVLKPWAHKLMRGVQTLKFMSWIPEDGYPRVLPVIEAQASDSGTIIIPEKPYAKTAAGLKEGMEIAIYGLNLDMTGALVKGSFGGFSSTPAGRFGKMRINRVYNSLPPKAGYIYP